MKKLYGIGTGPGDPDLLTLKAVKTMEKSDVIFVPYNRGKNMALDTAKEFIEGKKIITIDFPMGQVTRDDYKNAARVMFENIEDGKVGSFLTIGDSMIYSTFIYVMEEIVNLNLDIDVELVPGIPSFIGGSNRIKMPLTLKGENFILCDDFSEDKLKVTDSIVILKTFKEKEHILKALEENKFKYTYVKKVSLEDEEIIEDREEILKDQNYMSFIIARKK